MCSVCARVASRVHTPYYSNITRRRSISFNLYTIFHSLTTVVSVNITDKCRQAAQAVATRPAHSQCTPACSVGLLAADGNAQTNPLVGSSGGRLPLSHPHLHLRRTEAFPRNCSAGRPSSILAVLQVLLAAHETTGKIPRHNKIDHIKSEHI